MKLKALCPIMRNSTDQQRQRKKEIKCGINCTFHIATKGRSTRVLSWYVINVYKPKRQGDGCRPLRHESGASVLELSTRFGRTMSVSPITLAISTDLCSLTRILTD